MAVQTKPDRSWLKQPTSLLICAAVVLAAAGIRSSVRADRSGPNAPHGPVRVKLFDVYSGLPLANAAVEVTSDNGIRCEVPPCPTNGQKWLGRTDGAGVVIIPSSAIQSETYVRTKDHRDVKLEENERKDPSHIHQAELYPEWLFSEQYDWTRGYKLVDARSGKVLANTTVRIEFPGNDWPAQHGGIGSLDTKTNPLGYVFFSFLRKPEQQQDQTSPSAPLADWVTPEAWVAVSGYRKAKLNYFEGSNAERFTTRLQRQ